ncbi:ribonuclease P protein component [Halomonas sp. McH1-25]|uniref:ribonuclease P protein component n=1 Tax=unclassified Halomonas TaxID=2609666 RepID=UPI001EF4B4A4|nr:MULTISPECIES: ribonuclease P protein component [unclassified Halomonas]MCG7599625.1 ribonuclease P protein component [Halomonas sp. McH1-25]MCP1342545.1 ribonuclease P protein component [Halomonas sp. FL8]MCP1361397.1 ribonuclease P protein component [Halomonas sp. BBD45]MCP1364311.1 ribonuclease P protein component [Halomonas sp. BBD48]
MSCQGFPRQLRLLTAGEYRRVFDQASYKIHGKGLLALASDNALGYPRVGLVFSKKNVRRAVDRNRLKRLVRESIRLQQHRLPAVDIVVLARRGVNDLDNETLHRQLYGMWRRLEKDVRKQMAVSSLS